MGMLMLLVFRFGWAKPVPVNMYNFKNPKRGMAVSALAGPVGNILLSMFFLVLYGFLFIPLCDSTFGLYILEMIQTAAKMGIGLAVFNLIPVPPLDGSKVLFSIIGNSTYHKLMRYEKYGVLIMLVLIWSGLIGRPLSNAVSFIFEKFFIIAEISYYLLLKII